MAAVRGIFYAFLHGSEMTYFAVSLKGVGTPTAIGGKWDASTVRFIRRNGVCAGLFQSFRRNGRCGVLQLL